jgi:hypothetical protein
VSIIRTDHDAPASDTGSPGNDAVLEHGFREARLRNASILALGAWRTRRCFVHERAPVGSSSTCTVLDHLRRGLLRKAS